MAKTALLFQPVLQFFDDNGAVLNGGTLSFKEAGTTTDKDTYADKDQNTTNPNPITLDSAGRPDNSGSPIQIWLQGSYKIIVKDGDGNTIRTEDNVTALAEATGYAAKTTNYTATTADYSKLIDVDASSAAVTVTLPAAADAGAGFIITVRKSDGSSNTVTVDGNASETINGSTSITLNDQYQTLTLICDGSNWSIKANYGANTASSSDNRTDTVNRPFTVKSITSATPADGIGTGVLIQAESEDEDPSNFGTIDFRATDVSSATEDTEFVIQTRVAGADLSDAYKWRVTDSSNYIFTGAPTVERTVTLPDADVTFGGEFTTGAGAVTFGAGAVTFGANDFEADYTGGKLSLSGTLTADRVITIPDTDIDNHLVQRVSTTSTTAATTTSTIPLNDTIPQNTEGAEYITLSITPNSSSNILVIDFISYVSLSTTNTPIVALFQDSTADAIQVTAATVDTDSFIRPIMLRHIMSAGTTSSTTFKIRFGAATGTSCMLRQPSSTRFSTADSSTFQITEYTS